MSGLLQGGPAVLFAIVIYSAFFALAGAQLWRVLAADESVAVRLFGSLAVIVVSFVVWVLVGAMVYWGILLWFRFLLQEPHAWRQQILDLTAWFPFGALFRTRTFPPGLATALAILIGYPVTLLIAAAIVALWRYLRHDATPSRGANGILTVLGTKRAEERQ